MLSWLEIDRVPVLLVDDLLWLVVLVAVGYRLLL